MHGVPERGYETWLGLGVGKGEDPRAPNRQGMRVHDKPLSQDEARLRALFDTQCSVTTPAQKHILPPSACRPARVL